MKDAVKISLWIPGALEGRMNAIGDHLTQKDAALKAIGMSWSATIRYVLATGTDKLEYELGIEMPEER